MIDHMEKDLFVMYGVRCDGWYIWYGMDGDEKERTSRVGKPVHLSKPRTLTDTLTLKRYNKLFALPIYFAMNFDLGRIPPCVGKEGGKKKKKMTLTT